MDTTQSSVHNYTHLLGLLIVGLSFFWITACADSPTVGPGDPGDDDTEVTIEGTATEDSGYGAQSQAASESAPASTHHTGVSAATVTAASVSADGNTTPIAGETETNAEGEFSLGLEGSADVMLVTADTADYEGHVLVRNTGSTTIQSMPITVESTVESESYTEAKQRDDDEVREADAALYVDQSLAADVYTGNSSSSDVGVAIYNAVEAEFATRDQTGDSPSNAEVQEEKVNAFIDLQAALASATSAEAEANAIHNFEETMAMLDVSLEGSAQTQAQTRQAGASAAIHADANFSSDADLALRKRAEAVAAIATSHAIAATMEAEGLTGEASAIEDAGADLVAEIRASGSHSDIDNAKADFESTTSAVLATGLDVSESEIQIAQEVMSAVTAELSSQIAAAGDGQAIATAFNTFYAEARATAESASGLIPGGMATADVLIMLAAMGSIN